MTTTNLLMFILASYGATQILTVGRILNRVRPPAKFFHCPMCMGFWTGAFLYSLGSGAGIWLWGGWVECFFCACIGSGVSYWLSMLVNDDGLRLKHENTFCKPSVGHSRRRKM